MNSIPVRQIDQTPPPDRYARGWHCLGLSSTFKDKPIAVTAFGTRIVVFRNSADQAVVLEATCPHMGGDLKMVMLSDALIMNGAGVQKVWV